MMRNIAVNGVAICGEERSSVGWKGGNWRMSLDVEEARYHEQQKQYGVDAASRNGASCAKRGCSRLHVTEVYTIMIIKHESTML